MLSTKTKEEALVGYFSGDCKTSRRFFDSSTTYNNLHCPRAERHPRVRARQGAGRGAEAAVPRADAEREAEAEVPREPSPQRRGGPLVHALHGLRQVRDDADPALLLPRQGTQVTRPPA